MEKFTQLVYEPIDLQAFTKEVNEMLAAFGGAEDAKSQLEIFHALNKKEIMYSQCLIFVMQGIH